MSPLNPIGMLIGGIGSLFHAIERGVNSPEHNFKNDLDKMLEGAGIPEDTRKKIKDFLNEGKDEDIGTKLQALMKAGIIPPQMAGAISQLAEQDKVPQSSIDRQALQQPMSSAQASTLLGSRFGVLELGEDDEQETQPAPPPIPQPRHHVAA